MPSILNRVGHQSPGLWTHPRDRADRYNTLDYWVELVRILERGKFDALFLADVLGVYDVYRGSPMRRSPTQCRRRSTIRCCSFPRWRTSPEIWPSVSRARSHTNIPTRWRGGFRRSIIDRRAHRLECRHWISEQRRQGHGARATAGA